MSSPERDGKGLSRRGLMFGAAGFVAGAAAERAGLIPQLPNVPAAVGRLKDTVAGTFGNLNNKSELTPEEKTAKLIDALIDKADTGRFEEIASNLKANRAKYIEAINRPSGQSYMRDFRIGNIESDLQSAGGAEEQTVPEEERNASMRFDLERAQRTFEGALNEYEVVQQIVAALPEAQKDSYTGKYKDPQWYRGFDSSKSLNSAQLQKIGGPSSFFSSGHAGSEMKLLAKGKVEKTDSLTQMYMKNDIDNICERLAFETFIGEVKERLARLTVQPSAEELKQIDTGFLGIQRAWAKDPELETRYGEGNTYSYREVRGAIQKAIYDVERGIGLGLALNAKGYIQVLQKVQSETPEQIRKYKDSLK